jgi:hypothetical protein
MLTPLTARTWMGPESAVSLPLTEMACPGPVALKVMPFGATMSTLETIRLPGANCPVTAVQTKTT